MAIGTLLRASYWSARSVREGYIEAERLGYVKVGQPNVGDDELIAHAFQEELSKKSLLHFYVYMSTKFRCSLRRTSQDLVIRNCPSTPCKPTYVLPSSFQNKRKLHFFESTNKGREELDLSFQSNFELSSSMKKRCMSIDFTFLRHGRLVRTHPYDPVRGIPGPGGERFRDGQAVFHQERHRVAYLATTIGPEDPGLPLLYGLARALRLILARGEDDDHFGASFGRRLKRGPPFQSCSTSRSSRRESSRASASDSGKSSPGTWSPFCLWIALQ
ncbi:uncharacterized protein J3R85_005960 [Psidium guajava]|nr:uncharacterized protein J3R85_005960 [Psidium guajava]